MKIVAISGSLRRASSNSALLRTAETVAPPGMRFVFYDGLESLPHFNPDRDGDDPGQAVVDFRALLASADGVVVSSPEYVHGVPGALKDALDWIVSTGELSGKPLLLLNASISGGAHAQASLKETLSVMEAEVLPSSLMEPFVRARIDPQRGIDDPVVLDALRSSLQALAAAVHAKAAAKPAD